LEGREGTEHTEKEDHRDTENTEVHRGKILGMVFQRFFPAQERQIPGRIDVQKKDSLLLPFREGREGP
jgi:hypothetical protein